MHRLHTRLALATLVSAAGLASAQFSGNPSASQMVAMMTGRSTAGVLQLRTSDASQQIEIQVGPAAGEVRVFGVAGVPSGATFRDITFIDLATGAGEDYVEFRIFATVIPEILVNTRANNSDVKFIYDIPQTPDFVSSVVTVRGNTANDKVAFDVLSDADSFQAFWDVRHGNGDNESLANIKSENPTSLLDITFLHAAGAGQDKYETQVISGAAQLNLNLLGRLGAGNDSALFGIDEKLPGVATVSFDFNLGAGFDTAEAITVLRGGTATLAGAMRGGDGDDSLKLLLEGDGTSDVVMNGGRGNDTIDSEYKGVVAGRPRLLGGDGNDYLKIVADQPGAMNPFIDGGAGFDEAIGFGTIINVEKVN